MIFLYRCGNGVKRRVIHIAAYNRHGNISGAFCGRKNFDTSTNMPLGRPICKDCQREAARDE